ncbi:MAG: peptide chain release factor N(5)-glutamine methyltransferase [Patescibacteria group bacterium]
MTIAKALAQASVKLKTAGNTSPQLDAELLLGFVLAKSRTEIIAHPEEILIKQQLIGFNKLINRLIRSEPVAYLTGHKEFYDLDFIVNKNVLIPRPETELLVEQSLKIFNHKLPTISYEPIIADIGTGSGCLAITLKKYFPQAKVWASDISGTALAVARKNARRHKVNILFKRGDLLDPFFLSGTPRALAQGPKFDLIVANLPYLTPDQLMNKTIRAEPRTALLGGHDGLSVYQKLFKQIKIYRQTEARLLLEIDPAQAIKIKKLLRSEFPKRKIDIRKDLAGRNRVVIVE